MRTLLCIALCALCAGCFSVTLSGSTGEIPKVGPLSGGITIDFTRNDP